MHFLLNQAIPSSSISITHCSWLYSRIYLQSTCNKRRSLCSTWVYLGSCCAPCCKSLSSLQNGVTQQCTVLSYSWWCYPHYITSCCVVLTTSHHTTSRLHDMSHDITLLDNAAHNIISHCTTPCHVVSCDMWLLLLVQGEAQCCVTVAAFEHMLQLGNQALLETVMRSVVVFSRLKPHQKGQAMDLLGSKGLHVVLHNQQQHLPVSQNHRRCGRRGPQGEGGVFRPAPTPP